MSARSLVRALVYRKRAYAVHDLEMIMDYQSALAEAKELLTDEELKLLLMRTTVGLSPKDIMKQLKISPKKMAEQMDSILKKLDEGSD